LDGAFALAACRGRGDRRCSASRVSWSRYGWRSGCRSRCTPWEALEWLAVLPIAIVLARSVIHASVSRLLGETSRWTTLYVAAAFVLVVPASRLTIQLFPALNRFTDFIPAVKMGYPAFWTVVLVSGAVALGRR